MYTCMYVLYVAVYAVVLKFFLHCPTSLPLVHKLSPRHQMLLWCLALLDSVEVVCEVFMEQLMREPGKYGMVVLVQALK